MRPVGGGRVTNGRLLRLLALAHALVGVLVYRGELVEIAREGVVATVPYKGARASAFWFMMSSPLLWILAGLLHRAERAGDAQALRATSRASLASAVVAVACLPFSGFWGWLAISLRGLRDARVMAAYSTPVRRASRTPIRAEPPEAMR